MMIPVFDELYKKIDRLIKDLYGDEFEKLLSQLPGIVEQEFIISQALHKLIILMEEKKND